MSGRHRTSQYVKGLCSENVSISRHVLRDLDSSTARLKVDLQEFVPQHTLVFEVRARFKVVTICCSYEYYNTWKFASAHVPSSGSDKFR